jgi:hypothetical protein
MMIRDRKCKDEIKRGFRSGNRMDLNDMPVKKERLVIDEPFSEWNWLITGKSIDASRS